MMRRITTIFVVCLLLLSTFSLPVLGEEEDSGLTMEKVVQMAVKNNTSLKQANYDLDKSYEAKELAAKQANLTVPPGPITDTIWTVVSNSHIKDLQWRMSEKNVDVTNDKVVMSAVQKYIAVLQAKEEVDNAKKALDYMEWLKDMEQIRYRLGMTSKYALDVVEDNYNKTKVGYELAKINLGDAYRSLNDLIGINLDEQYPLIDRPEYMEFDVANITSKIQFIVDESPTMWLSEQNLNLSKMALSISNSSSQETYKSKQIDVKKAELAYMDAREQLEKSLYTTYDSIKKLEQSYLMCKQGVEVAQEHLRVNNLLYEVGMATRGEVLSAEADLAKAEKDLNNIIYQHEITKMVFEKPWAL